MARALKLNDLLEWSKIYSAEFDKPELHDRVLVFDVMRDGWEITNEFTQSSCNGNTEESQKSEQKKPDDQVESQIVTIQEDENTRDDSEGLAKCCDQTESSDNDDKVLAAAISVQTETETEAKSNAGSHISVEMKSSCEEIMDSFDEDNTEASLSMEPATDESEMPLLRHHKFFVHGSWLALQSSYFRSLFFSGMKETNSNEVHLKVSASEEAAHLLFLRAIYKMDTLDGASVDELLAVLHLAQKYDAKFAFRKCIYILQDTELNVEICDKIMRFIKVDPVIIDVEDLAGTLQAFLAKQFSPLDKNWYTKSFEDLSQPSLEYLLRSDDLQTLCERTVFHALMHWLKRNKVGTKSDDSKTALLSVVRFELIPVDYLYNVVQHHPIAATMADFYRLYLNGVTYQALTEERRKRLSIKPVVRNPITEGEVEDFVQYTWVIGSDELQKVVSTDEKLTCVFYCCGYEMHVSMENVGLNATSRLYTGELCLKIGNLTSESIVPVVWSSVCKEYSSSFNQDKSHTFSLENPKSRASVAFLCHGNVTNFEASSAGFNFGTSVFGTASSQRSSPSFSFGGISVTSTKAENSVPCSRPNKAASNRPVITSEISQSFSIDLKIRLA